MENKKQLLRALGIFAIIVGIALALALSKNIFSGNQFLDSESQPAGPRVISQNPMDGQRLDLSAPIEIEFDRDMEPTKTGDAFSLLANGVAVPGQLAWVNARTLTFTPDAPLDPGTVYIATFSTTAAAKDGTSPQEIIEIEFKTMESLAVAQVFPAADTQEVDLNTSITVIFNHPVVPVTIVEEQSKLPQPLKFSPEVKGKGEWVNSSVYVFQPDEILLSGTNYQVRVDAGIKDTLGNALDDSFSWQFDTRAPGIYNFSLQGGAENPTEEVKDIPLDQTFIVTFLQPMDAKSVENAVTLINRETQQAFPVKFSWDETFTTLTVEPNGNFKIASYYELTLANSAQASDGGKLKEGLVVQVATVSLPRLQIARRRAMAANSRKGWWFKLPQCHCLRLWMYFLLPIQRANLPQ